MDVWIGINPILKTLCYLASFGGVGSFLFALHFRRLLSHPQLNYCETLTSRFAFAGMFISGLLFFSVAGNLGGDISSAIDILMLQLALESKAGVAYLMSAFGFLILFLTSKQRTFLPLALTYLGAGLILLSFLFAGHALIGGLKAQIVLFVHLLGIAFWLGSFLPFQWMCNQPDTSNLYLVAHRFGSLALGYVGCLLIAGITYAYILLGDLMYLLTTTYGNVLLAKLMFVALLLSLGAINKRILVPFIETNPVEGVKRFKSSVQIEMALAICLLFLSSLLTTSLTLPMKM